MQKRQYRLTKGMKTTLNLTISNEAFQWYQNEMDLRDGDFVRFFVRYGGSNKIQPGFSLGISTEEPFDIGTKTTINGITYYIEEKDLWYFDGHDLSIDFNQAIDEPEFHYAP